MPPRERVVGLASTSQRRRVALELIPGIRVETVGGGEESDDPDLVRIALAKIAFAFPTIWEACAEANVNFQGVVAADTNTFIQVGGGSKRPIFKQLGKPDTQEETFLYFNEMNQAAIVNGGFGNYQVASGSAIQFSNGSIGTTHVTKVELKRDRLEHLTSRTGFQEYIMAFQAFYSSEAYNLVSSHPITLRDISGGISLPVLMKMGAVRSLDGVMIAKAKASKVELTLRKALFNVAVGFSPLVLAAVHSQAMKYIYEWNWLKQATQEALSENNK